MPDPRSRSSRLASIVAAALIPHCVIPETRPSPTPVESGSEVAAPSGDADAESTGPEDGFTWEALVGPAIEADVEQRWGVAIDVDASARGRFESPYDRYVLTASRCVEDCVVITRVRARVPSLDEARVRWDEETRSVDGSLGFVLDEGTSTRLRFSIRRFTVRRGSPGIEGQTVHRVIEVSRYIAIVPLDESTHLQCTGYVEHAATGIDDPAVVAVRAVCESLQRVPGR